MRQYKPIIMLGAGIIIALITSFLAYDWLQKKAEADVVKPLETVEIAVATINLPWGSVVTKDMVDYKKYLKDSLPAGHFTKDSLLEGRVVISKIKTNEPIFESSLAPESIDTGGVAAIISPNKRAMAIKVDKIIGVSGFIHPGNRVDVLVTLSRDGKPMTKTVLENVLVLAVGTDVETEKKGQKSNMVDVITLEVSPDEAEKLAHSAIEGKIQLAMRNFIDTDSVVTRGSTRSSLLASYSSSEPVRNGKRVIANNTYSVEIIKGSDRSKVRVTGGSL